MGILMIIIASVEYLHLSVGECKFIVDGCVKQPATRALSLVVVAVAVVVILAAVFIVGMVDVNAVVAVIVTELLMILLL